MRLGELAERIGGKPEGNTDTEISGVSGLDSVKDGYLTFISSKKYIPDLKSSKASAVITGELIQDIGIPQVIVDDPVFAFIKALELFYARPHHPGGVMPGAYVSERAVLGTDVTVYIGAYISEEARIGDRTVVYPGVFIGRGSSIGDDCTIYPNVSIREGVIVGSRVVIHPSSVIGSDGFGYHFRDGRHYKIPQIGGVIIEDDVEIGASVTIDRATTGNTVIGEGTRIDNLVQIAHNVSIGKHCIIVSQVGIAGSTRIGNYVTLAGQVGVSDHVEIEDGCVVGAQSGVMGRLKKGTYLGSPVMPHISWLKSQAAFEKLPELQRRIAEIEKELMRLTQGGKDD